MGSFDITICNHGKSQTTLGIDEKSFMKSDVKDEVRKMSWEIMCSLNNLFSSEFFVRNTCSCKREPYKLSAT